MSHSCAGRSRSAWSKEVPEILEADTAAAAIQMGRRRSRPCSPGFKLPDGDGLTVLQRIKEQSPETLVILDAFSTIENAVR